MDEEAEGFRQEAELATQLGFDAEFVSAWGPAIGTPGIRFSGQARFRPRQDPCRPGEGRRRCRRRYIYEHTEGRRVRRWADVDHRQRPHGQVLATCSWRRTIRSFGVSSLLSAALFQTKLAPYTSYVSPAGRQGRVPDALFWDTADPYHYLRIDPHRDQTS